jgi:U32 family peptidase
VESTPPLIATPIAVPFTDLLALFLPLLYYQRIDVACPGKRQGRRDFPRQPWPASVAGESPRLRTPYHKGPPYPTMAKKKSGKGRTLPELLAPAGTFEKMVTAIHYGADAVYLGGSRYSLRAKAGNFDDESMAGAVAYARERGVKVYVTVNIFAHQEDLAGLDDYLLFLGKLKVAGLIVADPGVFALAGRILPAMPRHLSTQANVTNSAAASFWLAQGASRLNLARELSLAEIGAIRREVAGELEVFVHGALCISYSGRCLLSSYLTGRDANQGNCAHPCRFRYVLQEEKRPGQYFPVEEDERGSYIFNAKDLCLLDSLPRLVATGVDSLKIEGRMKSIFYVGGVVRVYRAALDYLAGLAEEAWREPEAITMPAAFLEEIGRTGTRGMSENFLYHPPGAAEMLYDSSRASQEYEPVAVIRAGGEAPLVEIRNTLAVGETVEYMPRGIAAVPLRVTAMRDPAGQFLLRANPGNHLHLHTEPGLTTAEAPGIIRRRRS